MSGTAQIQAQIDLAVAAALAPLLRGMADLTDRVAALEEQMKPMSKAVQAAPAKKAVARAGTAGVKTEAKDPS